MILEPDEDEEINSLKKSLPNWFIKLLNNKIFSIILYY